MTQLLSALCLDYNTHSLKATGIKAYVQKTAPCSFTHPCTVQHIFSLRRLLHARSHDQTCIIPRPSHQPGATCQHTKPDRRFFFSDLSHICRNHPALTTPNRLLYLNMLPSFYHYKPAPLSSHSSPRCYVCICCIPSMTSPALRLLPHSHRVE